MTLVNQKNRYNQRIDKMAAQLPNDIVCKILADRQMPADTKMELEGDMGVKLFHPLQISDEFKAKLDRIYTNRTPIKIGRFDTQLYKNGKLTVIRTLGYQCLTYTLDETRNGKPVNMMYFATKYHTKNARNFKPV